MEDQPETTSWLATVSGFELLTFAAILLGPVLAILVARHLEAKKHERDRKMDVFRTLMRTRRAPISHDHVGALNLVEIEFANNAGVMTAFKNLISDFGATHTPKPGEDERVFQARIYGNRQKLLARLLHAIAGDLDFKIEQLEIFEGGYTPQGWHDVDWEQTQARRYLVDLASRKAAVPVAVIDLVRPPAASSDAESSETVDKEG